MTKILKVLFLLFICSFCGFFSAISAQGIPESTATPVTTFTTCYTTEGGNIDDMMDITTVVHVGYTSTGVQHFYGSGFDFVTQQGTFEDVLQVTPLSYDPNPMLGFAVDGTDKVQYVPVNIFGMLRCDDPMYPILNATPAPTVTPPVFDNCPAWAINGATGQTFCMWTLPPATNRNS